MLLELDHFDVLVQLLLLLQTGLLMLVLIVGLMVPLLSVIIVLLLLLLMLVVRMLLALVGHFDVRDECVEHSGMRLRFIPVDCAVGICLESTQIQYIYITVFNTTQLCR